MESRREMTDYKLGLYTDAQAPTIAAVGTSCCQIGLLKISLTDPIRSVVEHIDTPAQTENPMRSPIGRRLQLASEKGLTVLVIDLTAARCISKFHLPLAQWFGLGSGLVRGRFGRLRLIAHAHLTRKDIIARIGLHHAAVADMIPTACRQHTPARSNRELEIHGLREMEIEDAADTAIGVGKRHVALFGGNGIAIGARDKSRPNARTHAPHEMLATNQRDIEKKIRGNGTAEQTMVTQVPIAQRHAHGCAVPITQPLPIGVKRHGKLRIPRRPRPLPLMPRHDIDLAIGHNSPATERQAIIHGESRQRQTDGTQKDYEAKTTHIKSKGTARAEAPQPRKRDFALPPNCRTTAQPSRLQQ